MTDEEKRGQAKPKKASSNIWKILFFALLVITLFPLVFFFFGLSGNQGPSELDRSLDPGDLAIDLALTFEDVESMANSFIQANQPDQDLDLRLSLDQDLELAGQTSYLGFDLPFQSSLSPQVTDNGNVVFQVDNLTLRGFDLPKSLVLGLLDSQIDLPDFIAFIPSQGQIAINLTDFQLDNGGQLRVADWDQANRILTVTIILPTEVLGPDNNSDWACFYDKIRARSCLSRGQGEDG